ncbi:MAG: hypothetical protein M0Z69_09855 [Actinomycetota bacterium]|nr:hypothetical protein [Actinomycetota bacterium]
MLTPCPPISAQKPWWPASQAAPVAATALRPSDPRSLVAEILDPLWGLCLYVGDLAAGVHSEIAIYEVQRSVG